MPYSPSLWALTSVPITNTLLENQISSTNSINEQKDKNFDRPQDQQNSQAKINVPSENTLTSVTKVSQAMNLNVVWQTGCAAILLVLLSSSAALCFVTRYDPASILSNRD